MVVSPHSKKVSGLDLSRSLSVRSLHVLPVLLCFQFSHSQKRGKKSPSVKFIGDVEVSKSVDGYLSYLSVKDWKDLFLV